MNPPNGQRPRSQSIAVQSEAAPNAVTTGCPGRRTNGRSAPNNATDRAARSVKANQAVAPKRKSHDSVMPNPVRP